MKGMKSARRNNALKYARVTDDLTRPKVKDPHPFPLVDNLDRGRLLHASPHSLLDCLDLKGSMPLMRENKYFFDKGYLNVV